MRQLNGVYPWEQLRYQVFLGSEIFVEHLRRKLPGDRDLSEVPRVQRRLLPKPLTDYARMHPDREVEREMERSCALYKIQDLMPSFVLTNRRSNYG